MSLPECGSAICNLSSGAASDGGYMSDEKNGKSDKSESDKNS
jgi:hypothetical protein